MNPVILPQSGVARTDSNVIDLAERRAEREQRKAIGARLQGADDDYGERCARARAHLDHCAELSAKVWAGLEAAGYGRGWSGDAA